MSRTADFESLAFASPAVDLAQLVTHFAGWKDREDILRLYETIAHSRKGT